MPLTHADLAPPKWLTLATCHCHPSHACRWTQVSKQENQAHVVLATSEYSFTAWLAAGARGVVTLAPPFALLCHAARTWKGW